MRQALTIHQRCQLTHLLRATVLTSELIPRTDISYSPKKPQLARVDEYDGVWGTGVLRKGVGLNHHDLRLNAQKKNVQISHAMGAVVTVPQAPTTTQRYSFALPNRRFADHPISHR